MNRVLLIILLAAATFVAVLVGVLVLFPPALPVFLACTIRESEQQEPVAGLSAELPSLRQIVVMDAEREVQVVFSEPPEAVVTLESVAPGESGPEPMIVPFRCNFCYDTVHRLAVAQLPGNFGVELRAVLEIAPANPRSRPYLDKTSIPIAISQDDVDAVQAGDSITKVIYLPDCETNGTAERPETLTGKGHNSRESIRMEAERRGTLLAVLVINP